MEFIVRTIEQDKEYALMIAQYTIEKYKEKQPTREPKYKIDNPQIYAEFPDLVKSTLYKWCKDGKIGKKGADGQYYVTISQIEKYLLK